MKHATLRPTALAMSAFLATSVLAETADLTAYYLPKHFDRSVLFAPDDARLPRVQFVGDAIRPTYVDYSQTPYQSKTAMGPYQTPALFSYYDYISGATALLGFREGVCNSSFTLPSEPLSGGVYTLADNVWRSDSSDGTTYGLSEGTCDSFGGIPLSLWPHRFTNDQLTVGAPVRRTAIDGSQYDASPLKITRNSLPWYTYYMAYKLGPVANESNWNDANLSKAGDMVGFFRFPSPRNNFNLAYLPPPWVEDDVVEYVNRLDFPNQPEGQFFYAALATDKKLLDSVKTWSRTGNTFKSGGYVMTCRFYGGKNGGPNTHFYSSDDTECDALKQVPTLSYEGPTFAVNAPMPAKTVAQSASGALRDCPADSVPLYRLYNNASASAGRFVSNHRYTTDRFDVAAFVAKGWVNEGHTMCVPK